MRNRAAWQKIWFTIKKKQHVVDKQPEKVNLDEIDIFVVGSRGFALNKRRRSKLGIVEKRGKTEH